MPKGASPGRTGYRFDPGGAFVIGRHHPHIGPVRGAAALWALVGPDGTLLAARHLQAGLVVLSWTTREELEEGVEALFGKAPLLFVTHHPEQRTFKALLETSQRLGMRLRIDDFVVENTLPASAVEGE